MAEKTTEERCTEKMNSAIENLRTEQEYAARWADEAAVKLTELFKSDDEGSEQLREKYYLDYMIMKTKSDSFNKAINQIKTSLKYA